MNITEGNDADYFDPSDLKTSRIIKQKLGVKHLNQSAPEKVRVATFRTRQEYSFPTVPISCWKKIRLGRRLSAVISTLCRIGTQRHPFVFARFKPTVYEMLKSPENQNISDNMGSACVAMNRIEYGVKEELNMTAATGIVPLRMLSMCRHVRVL
jgi:hypothetical protein